MKTNGAGNACRLRGMGKSSDGNRADQLNPNDDAYWQSRGVRTARSGSRAGPGMAVGVLKMRGLSGMTQSAPASSSARPELCAIPRNFVPKSAHLPRAIHASGG